MPNLEYFLVARGASLDRFSNDLSIFSIVSELSPRRFPAMILRMVVITGWNVEENELGQRIASRVVVNIPGHPEQSITDVELQLDSRRAVHFNFLIATPVLQPGEIVISLERDGREIAHHRILVNQPDPDRLPDGWLMYQAVVQPAAVDNPGQ